MAPGRVRKKSGIDPEIIGDRPERGGLGGEPGLESLDEIGQHVLGVLLLDGQDPSVHEFVQNGDRDQKS